MPKLSLKSLLLFPDSPKRGCPLLLLDKYHTFCEEVKKEKLVDLLGEGIVGYSSTGEMLARISLDPFELSAMNVALQRKKIREYMLATNGYDDDDYQQLLKEFEERRAEKKAQKDKNK